MNLLLVSVVTKLGYIVKFKQIVCSVIFSEATMLLAELQRSLFKVAKPHFHEAQEWTFALTSEPVLTKNATT
jgi:hypothetical protein